MASAGPATSSTVMVAHARHVVAPAQPARTARHAHPHGARLLAHGAEDFRVLGPEQGEGGCTHERGQVQWTGVRAYHQIGLGAHPGQKEKPLRGRKQRDPFVHGPDQGVPEVVLPGPPGDRDPGVALLDEPVTQGAEPGGDPSA